MGRGDVRRIDIKEFREAGYLQEANRRFFHPLGLALEITVEADGTERLGGVWDYRDDPEGMLFGDHYGADPDKVARVDREWAEHAEYRQREHGFVVQPCGAGPARPAEELASALERIADDERIVRDMFFPLGPDDPTLVPHAQANVRHAAQRLRDRQEEATAERESSRVRREDFGDEMVTKPEGEEPKKC